MPVDGWRRYPCMIAIVLVAGGCTDLSVRIPPRSPDAPAGGDFVTEIRGLPFERREERIFEEIARGNVPGFLRRFVPVRIEAVNTVGMTRRAVIYCLPDYLAVGSDADYVRLPMSPAIAQAIADRFDCILPTTKMVDLIYDQAAIQLEPSPFNPRRIDMTSVDAFLKSHLRIEEQLGGRASGRLVAGIKKDVVISPQLTDRPGRVAIYGWHKPDGQPIQPLYLGHTVNWVDYSHGVRLVSRRMLLDGEPISTTAVLADPRLCSLISDEGPIASPRYDRIASQEVDRIEPLPGTPLDTPG